MPLVRHLRRFVFLSAAVVFAIQLVAPRPLAARARQPAPTDRLVALGKLWGFVKYHHPNLASRAGVDWDAALVAAIPAVRGSRSADEFRAAANGMLAALGDPSTRVESTASTAPEGAATTEPAVAFRMTDDNVLVFAVRDVYALSDAGAQATIERAVAALPTARAVVLDVRSSSPIDPYGRLQSAAAVGRIERRITPKSLPTVGTRRRVFYGFESASVFSSGQYRTGFFTRFETSPGYAKDATDIPCVVLLNKNSAPPDSTVSRQAAGRGLIVFEGDANDVPAATTERVDLGEGLVARVRVSEPLFEDGTSAELIPDVVVPGAAIGSGDEAETRAVDLARAFRASTVTRRRLSATVESSPERSYSEMSYPSSEYRLLALFRYWSAIEYFYPYKRLLARPWDEILPELVPEFERANDAAGYARAVARLATCLHDGHAYVAGAVFDREVFGDGYPPIRVRMIESSPIVTSLTRPEAGEAGVRVGDEIVSVDGEDARARFARYADLLSAATPQGLADKTAIVFLNGAVGSAARLRIRDGTGTEKEVTLVRRAEDYTTLYHRERTGEIVRILDGNVGYVDLDRLTIPMVDDMFERLRATKAIVFDMRGYPNGTVWAIAPRLTSSERRVALLETPLVGHDSQGVAVEAFYQAIDPTPPGARLYTGKTVMLVDERAASQAEHTGLYLLAANGTKFVGAPTAGTDGEITTVSLPGGMTVGFTGQSVRYPDGREIQGVGLVPDVFVRPTIEGIREGRDEVLETAVNYLSSGAQP